MEGTTEPPGKNAGSDGHGGWSRPEEGIQPALRITFQASLLEPEAGGCKHMLNKLFSPHIHTRSVTGEQYTLDPNHSSEG